MVFPAQFDDRADCDLHFVEHRQVLGLILLSNLITTTPVLVMRFGHVPARTWMASAIYYTALLIGIALPGNRRVSIAVLCVLIGVYLVAAAMTFIRPVAI